MSKLRFASTVVALSLGWCVESSAQSVSPMPPRLAPHNVGTGPVNGGRVHAITVHPADSGQIIVAAEFGGLWQSLDGGYAWGHLPGLDALFVHDVAYAAGGAVLVATVERDMSAVPANGRGGVWTSADHGRTWTRVAIVPPAGTARAPAQPSAYGIAVALDDPRVVVAGTDFGIVRSTDGGARWTAEAVPTGAPVAPDRLQNAVRSVLPLAGGRVLATTRSGLWLRAADGTWTSVRAGDATLAGNRALAPWPGRPDAALFLDLTVPPTLRIFEASTGRWRETLVPRRGLGRGPMLRVGMDPERPGARALWLGVPPNLLRASCPDLDCVAQLEMESWASADRGAHADPGDVGLDGDLRPVLYGNDGGLFRPTDAGGRSWALATRPEAFNSLQIASLGGTHTAFPYATSVYFATQDNGTWASADGGGTWGWKDCEGASVETVRYAAARASVAYLQAGCQGSSPVRQADLNLANTRDLSPRGADGRRLPAGSSSAFAIGERQWMRVVPVPGSTPLDPPGRTTQDLYVSDDDGQTWRLRALVPFAWRGDIQAGGSGDRHAAYVPYRFDGTGSDPWGTGIGLLRIDRPLRRGVDWVAGSSPQILRLPGGGSLATRATMFDWRAVYAVNPQDPRHVIAPDAVSGTLWVTRDGGTTWAPDVALRDEVTRGGSLRLYDGHPYRSQITAIDFDPLSPNRIFVGTRDAGIVYSTDGGSSWLRVPGSERIKYITGFVPRRNSRAVLVSSYGHGLWLFDPGTVRVPFVGERMCYGIRCFVILPPDAEVAEVPPDWKRLDVVTVGGGGIVGLRGENGVVTGVEIGTKSTSARFVPEAVEVRTLPVDAVDKPSGFGEWQDLVDKVPANQTVVGLALDGGKLTALITADQTLPPERLDKALAEATPAARAGTGKPFQETGERIAGAARPKVSRAALRKAFRQARPPITLATKEGSAGVALVAPGSELEVTATGFVPGGAPARLEIDGVEVGAGHDVAADGTVSVWVPVPDSLAIGPHVLRIVQPGPDGDRALSEGFVKVPGDRWSAPDVPPAQHPIADGLERLRRKDAEKT